MASTGEIRAKLEHAQLEYDVLFGKEGKVEDDWKQLMYFTGMIDGLTFALREA